MYAWCMAKHTMSRDTSRRKLSSLDDLTVRSDLVAKDFTPIFVFTDRVERFRRRRRLDPGRARKRLGRLDKLELVGLRVEAQSTDVTGVSADEEGVSSWC